MVENHNGVRAIDERGWAKQFVERNAFNVLLPPRWSSVGT